MKKYKAFLLLVVISAAVFILNMAVMYVLFDINVLNPKASLQAETEADRTGGNELMEATYGAKAGVVDTSEEDFPANSDESNMMSETDAFDISGYYMTSDEIAFLSQLGMEDKLTAMTILTKLGTGEMDRIYDMSLDGVTIEEYADIISSIESRLKESDIEALKEILNKSKMLYAENSR